MSSADLTGANARRKILFAAVSSICYEAGFATGERTVLETLSEMLQSFLTETCRSSRSYSELSGRSETIVSDVVTALIEMGVNVESMISYAKRPNRITLPNPSTISRLPTARILQAGEKRNLPVYIPEHYPPFPDPHTYIRTPTHRQPITEYEIIREKAATQKRDTERALTRFIAKTGSTHSLYPDDVSLFPLIACKPTSNPFFSALLFTDQLFDEDANDSTAKSSSPTFDHEDNENMKDSAVDSDMMDNPYLKPAKLQRKKRK